MTTRKLATPHLRYEKHLNALTTVANYAGIELNEVLDGLSKRPGRNDNNQTYQKKPWYSKHSNALRMVASYAGISINEIVYRLTDKSSHKQSPQQKKLRKAA